MTRFTAPVEEQRFVLRHIAGIEELGTDDETVDAVLKGIAAFAEGERAPLSRVRAAATAGATTLYRLDADSLAA